jgi:hypothetical protein
MIRKCLEDLEKRINPVAEDQLWGEWAAFCDGKFDGEVFSPKRSCSAPASFEWPAFSTNESLESYEKIALGQLGACSAALSSGSGSLMCVRTNYGVGILPSLFGASIHLMDEEFNTLPISLPLGSTRKIQQLFAQGVPDLSKGLGARVFECGQYMKETFAQYPNVSKYVHVYHPDLQGPLDVCDLLWGNEIFTEMYLNAQWFNSLLELVTETYVRFLKKWFELFPPVGLFSTHWGWMHKGAVMLRNDSAMNFSGETYDEFVRPHDQRVFSECGGGAVHFCGRGDHFIAGLSRLEGLHGIHMSQPHLNDIDVIFENTVDKGIALIDLQPDAVKAMSLKRGLCGRVHSAGWA